MKKGNYNIIIAVCILGVFCVTILLPCFSIKNARKDNIFRRQREGIVREEALKGNMDKLRAFKSENVITMTSLSKAITAVDMLNRSLEKATSKQIRNIFNEENVMVLINLLKVEHKEQDNWKHLFLDQVAYALTLIIKSDISDEAGDMDVSPSSIALENLADVLADEDVSKEVKAAVAARLTESMGPDSDVGLIHKYPEIIKNLGKNILLLKGIPDSKINDFDAYKLVLDYLIDAAESEKLSEAHKLWRNHGDIFISLASIFLDKNLPHELSNAALSVMNDIPNTRAAAAILVCQYAITEGKPGFILRSNVTTLELQINEHIKDKKIPSVVAILTKIAEDEWSVPDFKSTAEKILDKKQNQEFLSIKKSLREGLKEISRLVNGRNILSFEDVESKELAKTFNKLHFMLVLDADIAKRFITAEDIHMLLSLFKSEYDSSVSKVEESFVYHNLTSLLCDIIELGFSEDDTKDMSFEASSVALTGLADILTDKNIPQEVKNIISIELAMIDLEFKTPRENGADLKHDPEILLKLGEKILEIEGKDSSNEIDKYLAVLKHLANVESSNKNTKADKLYASMGLKYISENEELPETLRNAIEKIVISAESE